MTTQQARTASKISSIRKERKEIREGGRRKESSTRGREKGGKGGREKGKKEREEKGEKGEGKGGMEESREHRMEEGREGRREGAMTLHLCWKSFVLKVSRV